jgi:hypothetical protein
LKIALAKPKKGTTTAKASSIMENLSKDSFSDSPIKKPSKAVIQPIVFTENVPAIKFDNSLEKDLSKHFKNVINELNIDKEYSQLQFNFEKYLTIYERSLIPTRSQKYVNQILNRFLNLELENFTKPKVIGSYASNCFSLKSSIDLIIYHDYKNLEVHLDPLIKILVDNIDSKDISIDITKLNNCDIVKFLINFEDLDIELKDRARFIFLLRPKDEVENSQINDFLNFHEKSFEDFKITFNSNFIRYNFTTLQRLLRAWRRKNELFFILPELLDWIILLKNSHSLSESVTLFINPQLMQVISFFIYKTGDINLPDEVTNYIKVKICY